MWSKFINEISTSISVRRESGAGFRLPHKKRRKEAKRNDIKTPNDVVYRLLQAFRRRQQRRRHQWRPTASIERSTSESWMKKRLNIVQTKKKNNNKNKIIIKRWQSVLVSCIIFVSFVGRIHNKNLSLKSKRKRVACSIRAARIRLVGPFKNFSYYVCLFLPFHCRRRTRCWPTEMPNLTAIARASMPTTICSCLNLFQRLQQKRPLPRPMAMPMVMRTG